MARRRQSGALMAELMVAMGILIAAMVPLLPAFVQTQKAARGEYQRSVAMEIIDGEMEILAAGEWRAFKEGTQPYPIQAQSATNLPPGRAMLTITGKHLRLEWLPEKKDSGGTVLREGNVR